MRIHVVLDTNYPNADGKTYAELKQLVEYFGRKPRHYANLDVAVQREGESMKFFGDSITIPRTDDHSNSTH